MPTEDLWGDLPEADASVKPGTVLQEQAGLLASKTRNVIEGFIQTHAVERGVILDFSIRCPALDNYTMHLIRLEHELLHIYPLSLTDMVHDMVYNVDSETALRAVLKQVFTSPEVRKVIAALLREATSVPA